MKEYTFKGFTFYATNVMTEKRGRGIVPLYEIDSLKPAGQHPFLTSVRECREYSEDHVRLKALSYDERLTGMIGKAVRT